MANDSEKREPTSRIRVDCYAGYRGEQTPRRLHLDERVVEVVEVVDGWLTPDHRCFKLRCADGRLYVVRQDVAGDRWELTHVEP